MITELRMSPIAEEILERYCDYLLPVKVDDIASRLGVIIRALDEELSKNYSGLAYADVQQDLITLTIIKVSLLIDNVLPKYMN